MIFDAVYKATYDGLNWSKVLDNVWVLGMSILDSQHGIISREISMYKTSNGGLTWGELSIVLTYGVSEHNSIRGIHYKDVNNIVVAGYSDIGIMKYFIIYPNLATEFVHFSKGISRVSSIDGKLMFENLNQITTLSLNVFSSGTYIVTFENGKTAKLIALWLDLVIE